MDRVSDEVNDNGIELRGFLTKPWLLSITMVYVIFNFLWYLVYSTVQIWISNQWPLFVIILVLATFFEKDLPIPKPGRNRIAAVAIVWSFLIIYSTGGGILDYIVSPVDYWIFSVVLLIGPVCLLWMDGKLTLSSLGFHRGDTVRAISVITVGIGFSGITIIYYLTMIGPENLGATEYIELFVTTSMFPAVCEEIVWRGIIQDRVTNHFNSKASGVAITSFIFGLGHIGTNAVSNNGDLFAGLLMSILVQFLGGLVLGATYLVTGNLYASITLHYLHNASAWFSKPQYLVYLPFGTTLSYFTSIVSLVIVYLGLRLNNRVHDMSRSP